MYGGGLLEVVDTQGRHSYIFVLLTFSQTEYKVIL